MAISRTFYRLNRRMHMRGAQTNHRDLMGMHVQEDGGFHVVVRSRMAAWAVTEAGAPKEVWLDIRSIQGSDELQYDVIWVNKTATRLPEVHATLMLCAY